VKWFRFYSEVINDPKVQALDPLLFKAWVNLLCVAAGHDGHLPGGSHVIARMRLDYFQRVLNRLVRVGLVVSKEGAYTMHNWDKRQWKSDTSNERVQRYRKTQRNVTVTPPDTDTDTDTEADTERLLLLRPQIFALYERTFGLVSAAMQPVLEDAEQRFPAEWIDAAFQEAAENRARSWRYVEAILKRWEQEGPADDQEGDDYRAEDADDWNEEREAKLQEQMAQTKREADQLYDRLAARPLSQSAS